MLKFKHRLIVYLQFMQFYNDEGKQIIYTYIIYCLISKQTMLTEVTSLKIFPSLDRHYILSRHISP